MQPAPFSMKLESEYATAQERAGWVGLAVGVVSIAGRDRASWLHKLITADVEHLTVGQGTRAALLDAKGHFVADFALLAEQDSILLLAELEAKDPLLNTLRSYVIRERVQVGDQTGAWSLFALVGAKSDEFAGQAFNQHAPETPYHFARIEINGDDIRLIRSARARIPTTDILVPSGARERVRTRLSTVPELSFEALEILRIEAGLPRWGVDFDSTTLALEIPSFLSVRVDQGCYVGQEVVARLVHRGHVNRSLRGLKFEEPELPPRGALIVDQGKEVGSITSAAVSPKFGAIALGYVRREVSEPGTWLQVGGHLRAQVANLPFQE
jgi:folate-binding protein YgfZ